MRTCRLRFCRCQRVLDRLACIAALIIRECHWQIKTKICGDARYNLAFDLRAACVVVFDSVIPIGASQLNGVHGLIDGIAKRQGDFGIRYRGRSLGDGVDVKRKALAQSAGECAFGLQVVQVQFGWIQWLTIGITIIFSRLVSASACERKLPVQTSPLLLTACDTHNNQRDAPPGCVMLHGYLLEKCFKRFLTSRWIAKFP